jgi:acetyl esterase/lipase
MLAAGFAVASVQYRFSSAAIFPAQIHDVKGAVRFLRARSTDYGLDASRFAAWGSSSGGHLTALLATSGGISELEGATGGNLDQSSALQAAVDYFGPTAILLMNGDVTTPPGSVIDHDAPNSPESQLIGFDGAGEGIGVLRNNLANPAPPFPEKAALVMAVNPITHVDADDPPMFIAHGNQDTLVPMNQSVRLSSALDAVQVENVMRVVAGAGHGFGSQSATVDAEAIAFLVDQLMQPAGDYDRDGDVDGDDFLLWQREIGEAADPKGSGPDGNSDGRIDGEDLPIWLDHYGERELDLLATQVPEPTSLIVAVWAASWLNSKRANRQ